MKNLIRFGVLALLIAGVGVYLHVSKNRVSVLSPSVKLALSTKSYDTPNYFQRRIGDASVVKSIEVTKDEPRLLEVRVTYTYDGEKGSDVSSCGGVIRQDAANAQQWSCVPSKLTLEGEQSVLYRIALLDDQAGDYHCTDTITVDMYQHGGSKFLNQLYKYNKTWVDDEGFQAQLKQFVYGFSKCL